MSEIRKKVIKAICVNRNLEIADVNISEFESDNAHLIPLSGTNKYTLFVPKKFASMDLLSIRKTMQQIGFNYVRASVC